MLGQRVFILTKNYPHEQSTILRVFSTQELAESAKKLLEDAYCDGELKIISMELNGYEPQERY